MHDMQQLIKMRPKYKEESPFFILPLMPNIIPY